MTFVLKTNINMTFQQYFLNNDSTVKDALRRLGDSGENFVFVVGNNKELLGTITHGDVRRWILNNGNLSDVVTRVYNDAPRHTKVDYEISLVKNMMLEEQIEAIPVLDAKRQVVELLRWREVFSCEFKTNEVLEMNNGGILKNIEETPEYDLLVTTEMYIIKKDVVPHIPSDTKFNFTELILSINNSGGKIGVYPIRQHSWIDVGK